MADAKKEAFRRYLESAGVIDAMTKVLVSLYEEPDRPRNAIDYLKQVLGGPTPQEHQAVIAAKEDIQKQLDESLKEIEELKANVDSLEEQLTARQE